MMGGAANRRRGHDAERDVVKYLRAAGWPDAVTTRAKLGHDGASAPGDISVWPGIAVEVKDRAGSSWPTWCAQAVAEAGPNRVPVVVRRTRGTPDVGEWHTRIPTAAYLAWGGDPDYPSGFCKRTGTVWTVTTFAAVCELVREDVS